jgi:hypothetical protein
MNKVVLTYISALVTFVHNIVTSLHGYEQHKVSNRQFFEDRMQLCCPYSSSASTCYDLFKIVSTLFGWI